MVALAVTATQADYLALQMASFPFPRLHLQCMLVITITRTMIDNLNDPFDFPFSCFDTLSTTH